MSDEPISPERVLDLLRRSAPGANELLRDLEAMRRRDRRTWELILDAQRVERRTRGLRERVLHGLALAKTREPKLG